MDYVTPQTDTVIFGFDSAWKDLPQSPGAICALAFDGEGIAQFHAPELVSFKSARDYVFDHSKGFSCSLIAIDQPILVPNITGSRPVDNAVASLISFIGGGVQPANRSKIGMFCDDAPVWKFLADVGAEQNPMAARSATSGRFITEVFPALALAGLEHSFAQRRTAPKYNPHNRKKFQIDDWHAVLEVVSRTAATFDLSALTIWAKAMQALEHPQKADQDRVDAAICALIGLIWRAGPELCAAMFGDLSTGYMISPISEVTRPRLAKAAALRGVAMSSEIVIN